MTTKTFRMASRSFAVGQMNRDDLQDIVDDINDNIDRAWNEFARVRKLPRVKFDIDLTKSRPSSYGMYFRAESGEFRPKDVLVARVCDSLNFILDMVGESAKEELKFDFVNEPFLRCNAKLLWSTNDGDEGESMVEIDGDYEGRIFYDINAKKWYSYKDFKKLYRKFRF